MRLSRPLGLSLIGATLGLTLIVALASYFRRRKRRKTIRQISSVQSTKVSTQTSTESSRTQIRGGTPNADTHSSHNSLADFKILCRTPLLGSTSSVDTLTFSQNLDTTGLSAEQLCELGIDNLKTAMAHWEEAIEKLVDRDDRTDGCMEHQLPQHLRQILATCKRVQQIYEERVYSTLSTHIAVDSAILSLAELDRAYTEGRSRHSSLISGSFDDASSDIDSFVSALDMADLSDLEEQIEYQQNLSGDEQLALYEAALLELEHGSVPFRTLRTGMVNCSSDTEFLAKLHCIRLAMEYMFKDADTQEWFIESGKMLLSDLLVKADRDPDDFEVAFDDMMSYVKDPENLQSMNDELHARGVKMLSFFDVVIDFILFDSFDDLENPPSSVIAVVQNRWLSNGFKETALATAVWSVLKAKRRLLKVPKGFIFHFYSLSEHICPLLAWGFMGPESELKELCVFFKDHVLGFMRDVFSNARVRYTTVEAMAEDILLLSRQRFADISTKLAS